MKLAKKKFAEAPNFPIRKDFRPKGVKEKGLVFCRL